MRSSWEQSFVDYIHNNYPQLNVITNDRSTIPSRDSSQNLEIDIYIPSLRLGFEINGEDYHDHYQYDRDKKCGTQYSEEMYKEKFCESQGIRLINIWNSDSDALNRLTIDNAILAANRSLKNSSSEADDGREKSFGSIVISGLLGALIGFLAMICIGMVFKIDHFGSGVDGDYVALAIFMIGGFIAGVYLQLKKS